MLVQNATGDLTRRARLHEAAWMVAAGLTVLAALAVLLVGDSRYLFYGDTQAAYYGWWYHLGEQVRTGHWPLLDPPAWRAGNLAAEGQWGLFSPLVIGIGLLATVSVSVLGFATAVKLGLACAGALGVFRLVRSYDVPAPAAYAAAVAVPMGGMTQYLDLPSWAAGLMIWALLPWVWWALRRTMRSRTNPLPAILLGYLLVTVGYVYGTIMLVFVLVACLLDAQLARDRAARLRLLVAGALLGLVAMAVYLPGVLTVAVTARSSAVGGFGGKFSTDPLAMFTSVLPTAAVLGTTEHLLPYAYLGWFLPLLLWVDWKALRRGSRPLAGLLFMAVITLLVVNGPARLGPLRWPLRLQPFLVQTVVVLAVVALTRYGVRPSRGRLGLSLVWVGVAGLVAVVRAPTVWTGHLLSVVLVAAAVLAFRVLVRVGAGAALGGVVAAGVTLAALALQHLTFPMPPSPDRNMPSRLADYQSQLAGARGDVMVVGDPEPHLEADPRWSRDFLVASAWYLNPHRVQNTYTTISFRRYYDRYCMTYQGSTCPDALRELFAREPATRMPRVDLLGVSTLLLVRSDFPERTVLSPPLGWRVARSTPRAVTWVRDRPVPAAGRPVWESAGTSVLPVASSDRETRFRVDRVPAGGGRVVLSTLAWPGWSTDVGALAEPVDGYLLTVHVPADAAGQTVTVRFAPPGWPVEVACWWLAVVGGALWCLGSALLGRRGRASPRESAGTPGPRAAGVGGS
jgi:hypothetical protein